MNPTFPLNNPSLSKPRKRRSASRAQRKLDFMGTDWLRGEYLRGRSTRDLARELGASKGFVRSSLIRAGIGLRPSCRAHGKHTSVTRRFLSVGETGAKNHRWKGGERRTNGRIKVYAPGHPHADGMGYIFRYRLNLEKKLGRFLEPGEVCHHIDGNPRNDAEQNLALIKDSATHLSLHRALKKAEKAAKNTTASAESANKGGEQ